jgi:UDP-N-acetylglucosamine--N-acetylmuramyl-(pentapeptide) pyrophosphoryl-undecaprenol N-acetylglucosamine transferase
MELASIGLPALLVTFTRASENHQEKNALALAEKNAAEIIHDRELSEKLEKTVQSLINDDKKLSVMAQNIKQFANSNAASKIAQMLVNIVNQNTAKN